MHVNWNPIGVDYFLDELPGIANQVWGTLNAICKNNYGVIIIPENQIPALVAKFRNAKTGKKECTQALDYLGSIGRIKRYPDWNLIWIIDRWKYNNNTWVNDIHFKAAIEYLKQIGNSALVSDFKSHYLIEIEKYRNPKPEPEPKRVQSELENEPEIAEPETIQDGVQGSVHSGVQDGVHSFKEKALKENQKALKAKKHMPEPGTRAVKSNGGLKLPDEEPKTPQAEIIEFYQALLKQFMPGYEWEPDKKAFVNAYSQSKLYGMDKLKEHLIECFKPDYDNEKTIADNRGSFSALTSKAQIDRVNFLREKAKKRAENPQAKKPNGGDKWVDPAFERSDAGWQKKIDAAKKGVPDEPGII